jgi:hypothetical protein
VILLFINKIFTKKAGANMSKASLILVIISLSGLFILSLASYLQTRKLKFFLIHFLLLFLLILLLYFFFKPSDFNSKGSDNTIELSAAFVLYICMLLGMLFNYLYNLLMESKKLPFNFRRFVAPIFASPVVFLPLLTSLQNAELDLREFSTAKLMLLLIAFGNGFIWKQIVDQRWQSKPK